VNGNTVRLCAVQGCRVRFEERQVFEYHVLADNGQVEYQRRGGVCDVIDDGVFGGRSVAQSQVHEQTVHTGENLATGETHWPRVTGETLASCH